MSGRPTMAFVLSLVGGIIILLFGILEISVAPEANQLLNSTTDITGAVVLSGGLNSLCGFVIILGGVLQYTGESRRVRVGSVLVLVFGIVSLLTGSGGYVIGFGLSVVGALFGFRWKSRADEDQQPPQ